MMKERKVLFNLTSLMIAVLGMLFMFVQTATAYQTVGDTTCQTCHVADWVTPGELHEIHTGNAACIDCHIVNGDIPLTSNCSGCHPTGNPGEQALATQHDAIGQNCFDCHDLADPEVDSFTITKDQTIANQFKRHTVTGITTPLPVLPDVTGLIGVSYLTIEDIDGDGILEIIGTSGVGASNNPWVQDGSVAIFTWDGVDMGSWTQSVVENTMAFPNETQVRDMDNDGDKDIMIMDNFIAGQFTHMPAGIYYLENLAQDDGGDGDITDPLNWTLQTIFQGDTSTGPEGVGSYHRAVFMDVDGDGLEDFVTAKISMALWQNEPKTAQYAWAEWYKKEAPADNGTKYTGPIQFGDAGGFMFNMIDIDSDGDKDYVASQFFITISGGLEIKGAPDGSDPRGDSLVWLENPGTVSLSADPTQLWNRHTIDNWYTSSNPVGKGIEVIASDIDNDGKDELVYASHNHQDYVDGTRIWPGGIFYFEIPADPTDPLAWTPITIDGGDPNLDPDNATAVSNDDFADDRGGPYDSGTPGMVRAEDISGDGYPDLVLPADGKGVLYYYESGGKNGSALEYSRATLYEDPACMPGDSQIVDIDGDGDMEIISVIWDTTVVKAIWNEELQLTEPLNSSSVFIFEQQFCSEPYSDVDGDGFCAGIDNCPDQWQSNQNDVDGDGIGDWCDSCPNDVNNDEDLDNICADADNCPAVANPGQEDADSDGLGDVCDADTIYGTISGAIQAGVTVEIYQPSCGADILAGAPVTNADGYYAFGGLEIGRYVLVVDYLGYIFVPTQGWVDIPQGPIQSYDFISFAD